MRTRDGLRFTLFHTKVNIGGRLQNACVVVRTVGDKTANVRRIICGLDRAAVVFIEEARKPESGTEGPVGQAQAKNPDTDGARALPDAEVGFLCLELSKAYPVDQL
jgi:hypothetical protein